MAEWAIARLYQLPGQPEVVMEFKKKPRNWCGIRKETSLDDQRTDIKAASSHQGGSRLISEADLASIGMDNHQDTRSHSDTMASSLLPQKRDWFLLRFLDWFALLMAFVFVLQNEVNKSSSSSSSSEGDQWFIT